MRWHRDIVRRRWAARPARARTGRPATRRDIKALVRRLARENPEWGYRRIHGELAGLGVNIAASTVWEILKASGINPGRRRAGPTWSQFLRSQAEAILACDLFTVDLLDGTQAYVLGVIEHATRRIRILGVTLHPTGQWTAQQARNLLMDLGGQADRARFMIRDRGSNFTAVFDTVLADAGIQTVLCNIQTPRMNAITERWIGGCRRELLDRTLVWNQAHSADPARLRGPPQSAPATPLPARCRATETATRACRSCAALRTKTASRQWPDQRVSPGRITWAGFSARTPRSLAAERRTQRLRTRANPGRCGPRRGLACPAEAQSSVIALAVGSVTWFTARCRSGASSASATRPNSASSRPALWTASHGSRRDPASRQACSQLLPLPRCKRSWPRSPGSARS